MKTVCMTIDVLASDAQPVGRIDVAKVDATTEADIAEQMSVDDAEAKLDAAKFTLDKASEAALSALH